MHVSSRPLQLTGMSEPPNKKVKVDKEEVEAVDDICNEVLETEDENVVEEDDGFGLNSSDLEDLLADSDNDNDGDGDGDGDGESEDINDPTMKAYVEKYPRLVKQTDLKRCIEFIKLLENAKIDPYSCYDLDISSIITDPNYIIKSCDNLDEIVRRELWDEYCKNSTNDSEDGDYPEVDFVKYMKEFMKDNKMSKFYTDFNRIVLRREKSRSESVYSHLCKVLSKEKRQEIFNAVKEFLQIEDFKRIDFCLKKLEKLKGGGFNNDLLKNIKEQKIVSCYVVFLLNDEQLQVLIDRL